MTIEEAVKEQKISQQALEKITLWTQNSEYAEFAEEIQALIDSGSWGELDDAFYTRIAIGTGGIRGRIGVGPNRINNRTIGEAAQGLSQFIWDFGEAAAAGGVVVGYDARKFAKEYAEICAEIFAANNIPVFLFDGLRATPEISFAVRYLKATAGVMITASHNPRTDNGFKFYWSDGGQVVPPYDIKFMELVTSVTEIKRQGLEVAKNTGLVKLIGSDVDAAYFEGLRSISVNPSHSAKIVFSPMHGSGSTNVLPLLQQQSFKVSVVAEQSQPDSNFPTAHGDLINPEFPEVMALAVAQGESDEADVVIVSDPDADRIGVAAKDRAADIELRLFSGNEIGAMLTHFILSQRQANGTLPKDGIVIETFVTTTLISDIAKSFGVKVIDDLLVGFKYIAEIIEKLDNPADFLFAAEESLGYLAGTFTRDKDSAIAALLVGEMVSVLKDQNKTLGEYLEELSQSYGYYKNSLRSLDMAGKTGSEQLFNIMTGLRAEPPTELGGKQVLSVVDRLPKESQAEGVYKVGKTGDQLSFILSEDSRTRVTVRPSGTEPIIKFYIQLYSKTNSDLTEQVEKLQEAIIGYCQKLIV